MKGTEILCLLSVVIQIYSQANMDNKNINQFIQKSTKELSKDMKADMKNMTMADKCCIGICIYSKMNITSDRKFNADNLEPFIEHIIDKKFPNITNAERVLLTHTYLDCLPLETNINNYCQVMSEYMDCVNNGTRNIIEENDFVLVNLEN